MNITNYKLKDFLRKDEELVEDYSRILRLLDPIPTSRQLQDLNLGQVEFIKRNISNTDALPEIFEYIEGITEKELMGMRIVTFYGLFNSILKQVEDILATEEEYLTPGHSDVKWEAVEGSKRLSVLGILPMVDNLSGGDILKYEQILELPYTTVFKKLMLDTIKSDIQRDMEKLKLKNN